MKTSYSSPPPGSGSFYTVSYPQKKKGPLCQEKPFLRKLIEVQFVGNYGKETPVIVNKLGLNDMVQCIRYMPHEKCLELMVNSHVLLLIVATEGVKTSGSVQVSPPSELYIK